MGDRWPVAWVILHFVYLLIGWRTFGVFLFFFPSFAVMDNGSFVHKFLGGRTSSWSGTAGSHMSATFELPKTTMPLPKVAASLYSLSHDARKGSSFPSPLPTGSLSVLCILATRVSVK